MDTTAHKLDDNDSQRASIGSAVREILQESKIHRVVIRNKAGQKVIDISALLGLILFIGAPVLPALVILGMLVGSISVSFEKR